MAKTWVSPYAEQAVDQIYQLVLERPADPSGKQTWSHELLNNNLSVKEIIRKIGKSEEYRNRFVSGFYERQEWGTIITYMYRHFLAREPENPNVFEPHSHTIVGRSWEALVDVFIDSPEYRGNFGDDIVPGHSLIQAGPISSTPQNYYFCVSDAHVSQTVVASGTSWDDAEHNLRSKYPAGSYIIGRGECQRTTQIVLPKNPTVTASVPKNNPFQIRRK
jgi:hypothetical protein